MEENLHESSSYIPDILWNVVQVWELVQGIQDQLELVQELDRGIKQLMSGSILNRERVHWMVDYQVCSQNVTDPEGGYMNAMTP